ncbi:unnamed protein product [Paramecium octaurelia]|uniref:Uncharacterized protein n=1 Tax=Paramecium octaurelia TaxID=43137 RepID=A0A8S1VR55_PAROT|nr:unnamed protein product [Paramecium octaurelia]
MLNNQKSKPKFKPAFKLKQLLNTIGLPEGLKDQNNSQFQLYQQISSSIRKNGSNFKPSFLPSITNRKSLISTFDHLLPDKSIKNKKKELHKNYKKFNNLSIALNPNEQTNLTNDELQLFQSIKNSPQKQQNNNKSPDQKKTRKQKLIEFLKGQHQNIQFTTLLQKKSLKDQALLPSFVITKYQELQF